VVVAVENLWLIEKAAIKLKLYFNNPPKYEVSAGVDILVALPVEVSLP